MFVLQPTSRQLFNASSVRVAPKSTEMASVSTRKNQSIFVFAVTTIIYFPPGFVTVSTPYFKELNLLTRGMESIFGMHVFDTTDPGVAASQKKSQITVFVLSVATDATAFVAYWLARNRKDEPTKGNV